MSWRKEKEKGGLEVGRVKVVSGGVGGRSLGWEEAGEERRWRLV